MQVWKAVTALSLSLLLHVGIVTLLLPSEIKPKIAGGEQLASLSIGEQTVNALMAGAPILEATSIETSEEAEIVTAEPITPNTSEAVQTEVVQAEKPETKVSDTNQQLENQTPKTVDQNTTSLQSDPIAAMESINGQLVKPIEAPQKTSEIIEETSTPAITTAQEIPAQKIKPTQKPQRDSSNLRKRKTVTKKPVKKKSVSKSNQKTSKRKTKTKKNARKKSGSGGNTKTNANRGSSGSKNAKAKKKGNAAASNYPGKVYSKIARTRRRSAGVSGKALVRFKVSSSGQLAGISIARSSGNGKVDNAAIAHVKRSAPFPKPPAGAKRTFVIPIQFRR